MANLDYQGLDDFTEKMFKKLAVDYPKESEKEVQSIVERVKNTAKRNTPKRKKGKSTNTRNKWKGKVSKKPGKTLGVITLNSKKGHLIENGHVAQNGRWVEGAHMLEITMESERASIDRQIEAFVDKMLDL